MPRLEFPLPAISGLRVLDGRMALLHGAHCLPLRRLLGRPTGPLALQARHRPARLLWSRSLPAQCGPLLLMETLVLPARLHQRQLQSGLLPARRYPIRLTKQGLL
jgi:hypothetical protein